MITKITTEDFDWEYVYAPEYSDWRCWMEGMIECQYEPLDADWLIGDNHFDGIDTLVKLIPTNENWCGNFGGNLIVVMCKRVYNPMRPTDPRFNFYKVGVYGNDDFSLSIEYPDTEEGKQAALTIFNAIDPFITTAELLEMGMDSR